MSAFLRFLTNLDARAVRAVAVSVGLFLVVVAILVIGKTTAVFDEDDAPLITWMQANAASPWAIPATIAVFTIAGFLGAPQFVLIAAAVVAFGPSRGALYAWIGTMFAASVMFTLGRALGADTLRRYGGEAINRVSRAVGQRGFVASFAVRLVPLAPAVVVNMAAGVSHMHFLAFFAGTGLGIMPKVGLVALTSGGLIAAAEGGGTGVSVALGLGAAAWLGVMLLARRMLRARAPELMPESQASAGRTGRDGDEPGR